MNLAQRVVVEIIWHDTQMVVRGASGAITVKELMETGELHIPVPKELYKKQSLLRRVIVLIPGGASLVVTGWSNIRSQFPNLSGVECHIAGKETNWYLNFPISEFGKLEISDLLETESVEANISPKEM